jgi:excisionase family DNA binding protein
MNLEEIATKADLAAMEKRIIQALATQKIEKKRTLNIDEAAKYINAKSRSTMYKLTSSGELAYHKVGRANVFLIEDLDRYLESKRKSSVNEIREKVRAKN